MTQVIDSWSNVLTGMGTPADPTNYMLPSSDFTPDSSLRSLHMDPLARKIVSTVPYFAFKEGYQITSESEDDKSFSWITQRLTDIAADRKIKDAWKWANLYGFSLLVLATAGEKSEDMVKPLPAGKILLSGLLVFESPEVFPTGSELVTELSDRDYGLPVSYTITTSAQASYLVHHSRCIPFYGVMPPRYDFERKQYKGISVLQGIMNALQAWATAHGALPIILKDFTQVVYQIKDLADKLQCDGGEQALISRFRIMRRVSSILNAVILDTDESLTKHGTPVTGLKDLVDLCKMRLVAETGIPHTILLGESAPGLGATGEDLRLNWFDTVAAQQEEILRPALRRVIDVLLQEKGTKTEYEIHFNNLWKSTPKEEMDAKLNQAKVDQIYADMGLSPAVIFEARFGGDEYSQELHLEEDDFEPLPADSPAQTATPSEQAASTSRKATVRPDGLLGELSTKVALRMPLARADVALLIGAFQRMDSKDPCYAALGGDSAKTWAATKWKEMKSA